MRGGDIARIELGACEVVLGVGGAFCDGTEGESDVVGFGVGGVELAFRWDAGGALVCVDGYWSGGS